ncbi:hypothetical protein BUE80_DR000544 [Diplocarpon rosae]|nr:hypothetical protein BUE80_DR000544 [Diplocarpon rosae]
MRPTLLRAAAAAAKGAETHVLKKGAKRDPELYVLFGVVTGAGSLAGYYFGIFLASMNELSDGTKNSLGRKPTSSTSEVKVNIADGSMPWEGETTEGDQARGDYKYKYHPGGDPRNPPKDAPSALHSVVVPNVNLPKELHEKYNKWGKDGY